MSTVRYLSAEWSRDVSRFGHVTSTRRDPRSTRDLSLVLALASVWRQISLRRPELPPVLIGIGRSSRAHGEAAMSRPLRSRRMDAAVQARAPPSRRPHARSRTRSHVTISTRSVTCSRTRRVCSSVKRCSSPTTRMRSARRCS